MIKSICLALALLAAMTTKTADPVCKSLGDASAKAFSMPVHLYTSETAAFTGGKPRNGELVYVNEKTYILVNGKWRVSPITSKQRQEMRAEAERDPDTKCHALRDEAVNGEPATLYSLQRTTPDDKIDTRVWISKTRGVPLKEESDMDACGPAGKSHRTTRYKYTNVQPPAGVK
jgi:hypothetical protein